MKLKPWRGSPWIILLLIAGLALCVLRLHDSIPEYPADLLTYIGGYYAFEDGRNPYSEHDTALSLSERGLNTGSYLYIYSPAFMFILLPLRLLPYHLYRALWIGSGILSGWISLLMLFFSLRRKGMRSTYFLLMGFAFYTMSEPLAGNAVYGNVSPFILLAMTAFVLSSFRGTVAALAATVIIGMKVGLIPLVLFITGKRTILVFSAVILISGALSVAIFGADQFQMWFNSLETVGNTWQYTHGNNLSISNPIALISENHVYAFDQTRAQRDDSYRRETAARSRRFATLSLYAAALAAGVLLAVCAYRRFRKLKEFPGDICFSAVILYLLVFVPFVWTHYGLFLLIPLWFLFKQDKLLRAVLFFISMMLWSSPLVGFMGTLFPVQIRFIIPLCWYLVFLQSIISTAGAPAEPVLQSD